MIDNNLQLYSWIFSIMVGFLYAFSFHFFYKYTFCKRNIIKIILSFFYVITITFCGIFSYYKVNGGYIHYSFLVFWILGAYIFNIVKCTVKRHKK
jgi:hypothetical protein